MKGKIEVEKCSNMKKVKEEMVDGGGIISQFKVYSFAFEQNDFDFKIHFHY